MSFGFSAVLVPQLVSLLVATVEVRDLMDERQDGGKLAQLN